MQARTVLSVLAVAATVGCGGDVPDFPETAAVTGTVIQDGKPVPGATVQFVPSDSNRHPAVGTTDSDGRYVLSTFFSAAATGEGAVPGSYKVTVTKTPPVESDAGGAHGAPTRRAAAKKPTNLLPKQYAAASTSPLSTTIEAGKENVFPIELK